MKISLLLRPQAATGRLAYSVRRGYVDEFFMRQAPQFPAGAQILDLGGHKGRKRGQFDIARYPVNVTYANLVTDKGTDIQADASQLPIDGHCFDAVVCAELLEHVPDPRPVLAEVYRVLKPGGKLLITVPFLYRVHGDPYDFGRYTGHFWQHILTRGGFHLITNEPQGALYSVLVDIAKQYCDARWRQPFYLLAQLVLAPLHRLAVAVDQHPTTRQDSFLQSFTTGFGIVATKPRPSAPQE
ncbi:MAG: class I SAM-dependent methyltransferase [Caldilineaceae bacterium]|nr:class I SAM-dependent methyltransferase [Caldilineaceae bacterium]